MTALDVASITFFLLKLYFVDSNMFYFALQFVIITKTLFMNF